MSSSSTVVGRMTYDSLDPRPNPFLSRQPTVDDAWAVQDNNKGKGRSEESLTDEEYAMRLQQDEWEEAKQIMEDFALADSLDEGGGKCASSFGLTDQIAAEHRRALLALFSKGGLPGPSGSHDSSLSRSSSCNTPDVIDLTVKSNGLPDTTSSVSKPVIPDYMNDQFGYPTIHCMGCSDLVVGEPTLRASCGHDYCVDCIQDLVTSCTRDESLFPPKCCLQPIAAEQINPFLTFKLQSLFETKSREFEIPAPYRIFCPSPTCSAFLGSSQRVGGLLVCDVCQTVICPLCKQEAHIGETCTENTGSLGLKTLAEVHRWQKCPGCKTFVERTAGCPHMVCRCGVQFCYTCAVVWKGCSCSM